MKNVKFIERPTQAVLGIFKSSFVFNIGDNVVINNKIYTVAETPLKYVYLDSEEIEFVYVTFIEDVHI